MTNREQKINGLRDKWAELTVTKNDMVRELWKVEYEMTKIKETLMKYGLETTLDKAMDEVQGITAVAEDLMGLDIDHINSGNSKHANRM